MRILCISDEESKFLWDYFDKSFFRDIDLILAAGDLKSSYLTFLATMVKAPIVYVPGNHDKAYLTTPPEGCILADDRLVKVLGLRIVGLGGSFDYNHGPYQYTQAQMKKRAHALSSSIRHNKGFDILLTHAPCFGIGDDTDRAHCGFEAFNEMIEKYQPRLMVHGHVHMNYGHQKPRENMLGNTRIVNAFEKYIIEL